MQIRSVAGGPPRLVTHQSAPVRGAEYLLRWACLSVRLCVCVCLSASISPELHVLSWPIFCACYLWPWLSPPLVVGLLSLFWWNVGDFVCEFPRLVFVWVTILRLDCPLFNNWPQTCSVTYSSLSRSRKVCACTTRSAEPTEGSQHETNWTIHRVKWRHRVYGYDTIAILWL